MVQKGHVLKTPCGSTDELRNAQCCQGLGPSVPTDTTTVTRSNSAPNSPRNTCTTTQETKISSEDTSTQKGRETVRNITRGASQTTGLFSKARFGEILLPTRKRYEGPLAALDLPSRLVFFRSSAVIVGVSDDDSRVTAVVCR
ncbi:hypothetical protein Bbelb_257300 [Branchiostoma belcheri]|nr:hypothetical protein Bbelb_257300 [Branchiostoma belcheri]